MQEELTVEVVTQIWISQTDKVLDKAKQGIEIGLQFRADLLQLLAKGRPVSPETLTAETGLPIQKIRLALDEFAAKGGEFNEDGHVVGAALTLNPTPHRFRVNGNDLYAWCALDTLFLPGLLDQTAEVESTCPVTDELIHLTITPQGVATYNPPTTVLSITVPGISCSCEKTGPQSDTCSQIHFFSSYYAAESWITDHPGLAIFTVEEAFRLAQVNWIERREMADHRP